MDIRYQGPVIFVEDVDRSREFYDGLLGQEVNIDMGLNVSFKGGFALWQVDHASEMIYGHAPDRTDRLGRQNFELYFETPDLDALSVRLSEAGVEFVQSLREQPWGQRVFHVHDPDGHVVELGELMDAVFVRLLDQGYVRRSSGSPYRHAAGDGQPNSR